MKILSTRARAKGLAAFCVVCTNKNHVGHYDPTSITEDFVSNCGNTGRGSKVESLPEPIVYNDEMRMELLRCSQNPKYFISKYVKIWDNTDVIPFKLYDHQEELANVIMKHRKVICLQSRRAGISSFGIAYLLWSAMFQRGSSSLHASPTYQGTMFAKSTFQSMYNNLPRWLIAGTTFSNRTSMEFENDARISFDTIHESTGRGRLLTNVVLADFGHVRESIADSVWASVMPSLSESSMLLIHSSLGENAFFNRVYDVASFDGPGFVSAIHAHKIDCYKAAQHKDLDRMKQMIGKVAFRRQFLCEL